MRHYLVTLAMLGCSTHVPICAPTSATAGISAQVTAELVAACRPYGSVHACPGAPAILERWRAAREASLRCK